MFMYKNTIHLLLSDRALLLYQSREIGIGIIWDLIIQKNTNNNNS